MLEYKGYIGHAEYDGSSRTFHGEVLETRDVITFQGTTVEEVESASRESIDDYLELCERRGESPDKPFSGRLMLRLPSELHGQLFVHSKREGKSLNQSSAERFSRAS